MSHKTESSLQRPTASRLIPGLRPIAFLCYLLHACLGLSAATSVDAWLSPTNLMAWCIVPFDSRHRAPEERAAMLEKLGFSHFAYDWRAEHVPTFDAEVAALQKHHVQLDAWWFPADLNAEAKAILACIEKQRLHPTLWVMLVDPAPEGDQAAKVAAGAKALTPVVREAARLGCKVGLYNHGGWFGEPENQLAIMAALQATNVGLVYNFHHGHGQLDRLPALLERMRPHLLCVNLNGMIRNGDQMGKKIIPFGDGDDDLKLLRLVRDSGYRGPLGILGHTEEDAEVKLMKDLAGFKRVSAQLLSEKGRSAGTPKTTGVEPGTQSEADWSDNRWQQTQVGPMLACNLKLPDGVIAKGLAVNLDGRAGVAYDTATLAFRSAWTGSFVSFDSRRFGLIAPPQPQGEVQWLFPAMEGWPGHKHRLNGIHLNGNQLILDYEVEDCRVLESPQISGPSPKIFLRHLEIDPATKDLRFVAGILPSRGNGKPLQITPSPAGTTISSLVDGRRKSIFVSTPAVVSPESTNGIILCSIPSGRTTRRITVAFQSGTEAELAGFPGPTPARLTEVLGQNLAEAKPRWGQDIVTEGKLGTEKSFMAVDTLTMPYENPWHSLLFAAGIDFDASGAAYVATIHGDVWRVTGIDKDLRHLRWHRYATGLFQPLGLKVQDNMVYVLGRDRITRLHDSNHDGEADYYESFCDLIDTSTSGHDYVTSLEKDQAGNFYFVDPRGVHRVSPDGKRMDTLATGFRNPNGMGVNPAGTVITVAPQQGEWTPSSVIVEVRTNGYYGFGGPKATTERPLGFDLPLCYIPHGVDNSSGSQVWIPPGHWGPLGGLPVHLLWGRCTAMLLLRDVSQALPQGAVVPLPVHFLSGPNRGIFHTEDDCLYIAGSTGWQTSAVKDGCFQRIRLTGRPMNIPVAWKVHEDGMEVSFSSPLDKKTASDPGSFGLKQWNYRYQAEYGSKDWSVLHPDKTGRDEVPVASSSLLDDNKTVRLHAPVQPVMQLEVSYNLDTATGEQSKDFMWLTLNALPPAR
ncbi:MAG TPA: DUF6797 domain-containing protein [Candidatus Limnocylindria bacterium]|nr:DUF6797 domain-containing protein [Candidatus Limnocylindria bacterium]